MQRYIRKPTTVHAFQWDGNPKTLIQNLNRQEIKKYFKVSTSWLLVSTPSGIQTCSPNDYVIKLGQGQFVSCDQKRFEALYRKS